MIDLTRIPTREASAPIFAVKRKSKPNGSNRRNSTRNRILCKFNWENFDAARWEGKALNSLLTFPKRYPDLARDLGLNHNCTLLILHRLEKRGKVFFLNGKYIVR